MTKSFICMGLMVIAAVLSAASYMLVNGFIAYAAFVALFCGLIPLRTKKKLFLAGFLYGLISSLMLNAWMIIVITDYVQGSFLIGLVCYIVSALVIAVFFGLLFLLFGFLRLSEDQRFGGYVNAAAIACLWVLFEWVRSYLFSALPWLSFSAGITVSRSLFLIQPAAFGGTFVLSFLIVFSSWIIAKAVITRKWKLLLTPLLLLVLQLAGGALMFNQMNRKSGSGNKNSFSAALIQPALSPETVWNESNADELVGKLFGLGAEAAGKKTDLIIWTETVVPWTYAANDDFLKEVGKMTGSGQTFTLIGMNRSLDNTGTQISNSVHLLNPKGKRIAFYDKQDLLTLVEKPMFRPNGKIILPFLATSGLKMYSGVNDKPVLTPGGKAGVLLCNESVSSFQARKKVEDGASFLVNMGNDSWFSESYISLQHFYNCRMRAVENRKDVLVNNNMGFSGLIRSSGEITLQSDGSFAGVQMVNVQPNNIKPFNSTYFMLLILAMTLLLCINKLKNHSNNKSIT